MTLRRVSAIGFALVLGMLLLAACGSDSNSDSTSETTGNGGVTVPSTGGGTTVNIVVSDEKGNDGPMTMSVDPESAPAGDVTFVVKNDGTVKHEMVVLKVDTPYDQLAVTNDRVSESDSAGEVPDVEPGKTGSVTLTLEAGEYALVCNIAKHYDNGMRSPFTVT